VAGEINGALLGDKLCLKEDVAMVVQGALIRDGPILTRFFNHDGRLALRVKLLFQRIQFSVQIDGKPGLLRVHSPTQARKNRHFLIMRRKIVGIVNPRVVNALEREIIGILIIKRMLLVPFVYRPGHQPLFDIKKHLLTILN
jgi:hypothetical protein